MKKGIAMIMLIAQISCKEYSIQPLDDVDKIQIHDGSNGQVYNITDTASLNIFKEVLDGKSKSDNDRGNLVPCEVEGWLWFMRGAALKEIGSYSSSKPDCSVLIFNEGEAGPYRTYQLTNRAAVYLNTVKNKKNSNVGDNQYK